MPTEAKEGIVIYSANIRLNSPSNGSFFVSTDGNSFIDISDNNVISPKYSNTEYVALSRNSIETLDLISEGEIDGLLTGKYIFSGQIGSTGWASAQFSGYVAPTGYSGYEWLRSVYWNEVPVLNDNGQFNFQNIQAVATNGLPNGLVLEDLLDENTSSRSIGERLRFGAGNSKIYRILNRNCNGCIINVKVTALYNSNNDDGNTNRNNIRYKVYYRPIFSVESKRTNFGTPVTEVIFGKIQSAGGYIRSTRLNFNTTSFTSASNQSSNVNGGFLDDPNFLGWEIKVERITEESTSGLVADIAYIDSLTELYSSRLSYPSSAIVKTRFDSDFFASIPERAFECKLLKVKIPGNYNPILRTYATNGFATTNGYWNGEFATGKAWTNNPAWCFYDMINNKRYGLGRYIDDVLVDKFSLYKIAQYCDELVSDGEGGIEPRFTFNTWIAGREDAFNVINDMASVFRGIIYYANGGIYTVQDSKRDANNIRIFTNANVENGDFSYSSTSKKSRQSVAIVRYINPRDFYKPSIEYVEDIDSIRKYGVREIDLTAFACTSRGQAIRFGRWSLLSNNVENETVQFSAGLEGVTLRPGDIFKINDFHKKTKRFGGRTYDINNAGAGTTVTLDTVLPEVDNSLSYKLSVLTPSYYFDQSQVSDLNAGDIPNIRRSFVQEFLISGSDIVNNQPRAIVSTLSAFNNTDYNISGNLIWTLELGPNSVGYTGSRYFSNNNDDLYRIINIRESDVNKYDIVGLKYWADKFNEVDSGILYQRSQLTSLEKTPTSPHDLVLNAYNISNYQKSITYTFLVDNYNYINSYKIYASTGQFSAGVPEDRYLINTLPVNLFQGSNVFTQSGNYLFRVYSYNEIDNIYSPNYADNNITIYNSLPITSINISNIGTN